MRVPEATAIVDLQFGSTGKGSIAAWMGEYGEFDAVATSWGPNAGHTSMYPDGSKAVRTMLSNAAFNSPTIEKVFIGPGSVVDMFALAVEMTHMNCHRANKGLSPVEVLIHEAAAVVLDVDRSNEAQYGYMIGSTMKGTAEAVIRKMKRIDHSGNPAILMEWDKANPGSGFNIVRHSEYLRQLYACRNVLLEGCQGYSLGINSGFWPHTTSRECTLAQLLSDTLMPVHSVQSVIGTLRTFPIRVANRYRDGAMIGTSGPGYTGQKELQWEQIGVEPELTTVTKLPRRIFEFSMAQVQEACIRNSVDTIFANFMNYLPESEHEPFVQSINESVHVGASVGFIGHGPCISDIQAVGVWAAIQKAVSNGQ